MKSMNMKPRRHFLTTLGASTLALSLRHVSLGQGTSEAMKIALLSDTHLHAEPSHEYRSFRPYDNLVQASKEVLASEAKFAMLCGDAARLEGKTEDYVQLKKLLEPITSKMKMEIALGNHDDRANFWTVFKDRPIDKTLSGKKHVSVADLGPQRWIVLDSLMYVDKTPGFLGKEQRDWLDKFLGSDLTRPVVLMVHHTLGQRDGDLLDTERLLAIANKHPNVKAIVFGHSHQWRIEQREKLWLINLPALGYNFADDQPIGWVKAELRTNELLLTLSVIGGNKTDHDKTQTLKWLA